MPDAIVYCDGLPALAPLTDLRASFDVRTGALTTLERLERSLGLRIAALLVPERLAAVTRERHLAPVNEAPTELEDEALIINGRCPLDDEMIATRTRGQRLVEAGTGELIAACVSKNEAMAFIKGEQPAPGDTIEASAPALLSRPWHVITFRDRALEMDLALLSQTQTQDLPPGVLAIGESDFTIAPDALVYPGVTLDLEHGPIVIAEHATIRPGAIVHGPCYVGPHATVLDGALIKGGTTLGPWCKAAGEVGGTIFQSYSNKAHDGHLGDSYIGEWVNLGAGTTNSNLLNTYAEVIAKGQPQASNERTGLQFLGAIVGDHVKTAICTKLMTGCVLHTGQMFAESKAVSGCVPAFTWATDEGRKPYRFEKFIDVARAMMARRKVEPSEAYAACLKELHASRSAPSRGV